MAIPDGDGDGAAAGGGGDVRRHFHGAGPIHFPRRLRLLRPATASYRLLLPTDGGRPVASPAGRYCYPPLGQQFPAQHQLSCLASNGCPAVRGGGDDVDGGCVGSARRHPPLAEASGMAVRCPDVAGRASCSTDDGERWAGPLRRRSGQDRHWRRAPAHLPPAPDGGAGAGGCGGVGGGESPELTSRDRLVPPPGVGRGNQLRSPSALLPSAPGKNAEKAAIGDVTDGQQRASVEWEANSVRLVRLPFRGPSLTDGPSV